MSNPVELILKKRDGHALSADEIGWLVNAYTNGDIPDYQVSAFLMAAFLDGLNEAETAALTDAMLYSGTVLDLGAIPGIKVDKHSTGGVGDKVSLVLAPIAAACGVPVPMISGRGLGHTGGTLDKLESIPGFRVDLPVERFHELLATVGLGMIGQTAEIAPADKKIYALRDVTGTVEYIPFIAASIMSKKLAEGADALVLDVKCGRGAFMKSEADARRLAETLVEIGRRFGKSTVAWLTRMDNPLGYAAGNWPEVVESIRMLNGEEIPGLTELTLTLTGEMIYLGGKAADPDEGYEMARQAVASGAAFRKFVELAEAQGGDSRYLHDPETRPLEGGVIEVRAPAAAKGFVTGVDALAIGKLTVDLGAGRRKKEDPVDPTAGIVLNKMPGDPVQPGEVLAVLYTRRSDQEEAFAAVVQNAFTFEPDAGVPGSLLMDRYTPEGWSGKRK